MESKKRKTIDTDRSSTDTAKPTKKNKNLVEPTKKYLLRNGLRGTYTSKEVVDAEKKRPIFGLVKKWHNIDGLYINQRFQDHMKNIHPLEHKLHSEYLKTLKGSDVWSIDLQEEYFINRKRIKHADQNMSQTEVLSFYDQGNSPNLKCLLCHSEFNKQDQTALYDHVKICLPEPVKVHSATSTKVTLDDVKNATPPTSNIIPFTGFEPSLTLEKIRLIQEEFAIERDWNQFHTPRNLLMALTGEVGELNEIFQWRGDDACAPGLPKWEQKDKHHLGEELSDVLLYLLRLADRSHIDLSSAVLAKAQKNGKKYPVDKSHGSSAKYTTYQNQSNQLQLT